MPNPDFSLWFLIYDLATYMDLVRRIFVLQNVVYVQQMTICKFELGCPVFSTVCMVLACTADESHWIRAQHS
jgi:hypothetical protein